MAVVLFFVTSAQAQTADLPLNVHPPMTPDHPYDYTCCSRRDCAPVEVHIENGFYVWRSWRHPEFIIRVPTDGSGRTRIKPSFNAQYHGCELEAWEGGFGVGSGGKITGMYAICLYIPLNM